MSQLRFAWLELSDQKEFR